MQPVTEDHEETWLAILEELEEDQLKHPKRMPSTTAADSAYKLEDIRSWVAELTVSNPLSLMSVLSF